LEDSRNEKGRIESEIGEGKWTEKEEGGSNGHILTIYFPVWIITFPN